MNGNTRAILLLVIVAILTIVFILVSGLAFVEAAAAADAAPTTLKLSSAPKLDEKNRPVKGILYLTATLAGADGKPLSNRSVDFFEQVELFGPRLSYLGSATTDSTGAATLVYQPARVGPQTIKLSFAGAEGYAEAQASSAINVAEVAPPFEPEPLPFATVRGWLPVGIGGAILATWVVLLGALLSTAFGIRAAAGLAEAGRRPAARIVGDGKITSQGGGR